MENLSKVYDRMQWSFIDNVLNEYGIIGAMHKLIMTCITSVTYHAIVNDNSTGTFAPACGLRQGDPLSSYIFVLCMEKLSHSYLLVFEDAYGNLCRYRD